MREWKRNGAIVDVSGVPVFVPLADLWALEGDTPPPSPIVSKGVDPGAAAANRSIEALRFGIVPRESLQRLTIGIRELEAWVTSRLPDTRGGTATCSEVCGAFGAGKSHMMAAIRDIALRRHYVVAQVEIDGETISLSSPGTLLYHICNSFAALDLESDTPLVELNMRAADRNIEETRRRLEGFSGVSSNFETVRFLAAEDELDEFTRELESLMSGSDQFLPATIKKEILWKTDMTAAKYRRPVNLGPRRLVANAVSSRAYDFCRALLGYAELVACAGYAGLVVTLDEFEVDVGYRDRKRVQRILDLLNVLIRFLWPNGGSARIPLAMFFGTIGGDDNVGGTIVAQLLELAGGERRVLASWTEEHLLELAERIHALYVEAYSLRDAFDLAAATGVLSTIDGEDAGESGQVRAFIKHWVAHLDQRHGPPNA